MLTTLVGDSVVRMRVLRNCPIILDNRFTHVELVEVNMVDLMSFCGWIGCIIIVFLPLIVEQILSSSILQMNSL